MSKGRRHLRSFVATDIAGHSQMLKLFVRTKHVGSDELRFRDVDGAKFIQTEWGEHVDKIGPGKYEVAVTGVVLTSTAPNAA